MGWWKNSKHQTTDDTASLSATNLYDNKDVAIDLIKEFSPKTYEEVELIANALVARKSVKLNLQNTIIGDRRRIIDFLCGIAYVLDLDIKKNGVDIYEFKLDK